MTLREAPRAILTIRSPKKNKAVDAVCRQRPCQPRTLKSARAIRYTQNYTGPARGDVI